MPADPYRNFKFEVEVGGFTRAGFSKVTGLTETTEVIDYREGGENETPRRLPGQTTFDPVVLERGMSIDKDFQEWRKAVYDVDQVDGAQGDDNFRRTIIVYLKNKAGTRVKKWVVHRAWPSIESEADLDGGANDVLIESLTLANEGVKRTTLV
jgi:phage tail-like protein